MRRAMFLALALALVLAASVSARAEAVLRIGFEGAYPPFNEIARNGKPAGFDIDVARALCAQMKVRCEFVQRTWHAIQEAVTGKPGLLGGQVDAIVSSVSITPSRERTATFTKPYYHVPAEFVAREGTMRTADAATLRGKRIGVQAGTTHDAFVTSRFGSIATIVRFDTLPDATAALARGRVDVVLADALAIGQSFIATSKGKGFAFVAPAFTDPEWFGDGVGIVVKPGDNALRAELNRAIDAIRADGTYQRISQRYFAFDIGGH
jgi:arginine/ornithine transport system substrate-binding protein